MITNLEIGDDTELSDLKFVQIMLCFSYKSLKIFV